MIDTLINRNRRAEHAIRRYIRLILGRAYVYLELFYKYLATAYSASNRYDTISHGIAIPMGGNIDG